MQRSGAEFAKTKAFASQSKEMPGASVLTEKLLSNAPKLPEVAADPRASAMPLWMRVARQHKLGHRLQIPSSCLLSKR
jgi:hypothetical protein